MRLMIASDIHGSAYYCQKLMAAFEKETPDKLLLLGDLLYHGPRNDLPRDYQPKEVISMLNTHCQQIICVRGNCEAEVDQMVLEFPIMSDSCILFHEHHMIFATHGHIYNPQHPPKLHSGDILLNGHTHVSCCKEYDDFLYINPGSVSIPKEDTLNGYILFNDEEILCKNLDGKIYKTYRI